MASGLQTTNCCCCGRCKEDAVCCTCACRFLCVKLEIPAGCGTPDVCTLAEVELTYNPMLDGWGPGTIACGNVSIDVLFLLKTVGADCKLCLQSTCLGYPAGSESCKPDAGSITCATMTASWPLTAQQISDCSGAACSTTATLSTKCSIKHPTTVAEGLTTECLSCSCVCDCVCFSAIISNCPAPLTRRQKGCWDSTIPGFRVTLPCGVGVTTVRYTTDPVTGDCIVTLTIPNMGVDQVMGLTCFDNYATFHVLLSNGGIAICLDIICLLCDDATCVDS